VDLASGAVRTAWRLEGGEPLELVERATGEIAASLGRAGGALDPGDVSTRSLVAYRFYEEGLRSFVSGDYRAARHLFGAALREDSTFAMAAFYRLRSAVFDPQESGELERVTRLAAHASDRERLVILGWLAVGTNAANLAAIAETLTVRYPAELDAQFFAGFARVGRGEYAAALPYLHRVLAMDSTAVEQNRARCLACEALQQLIYSYHALDSLARAEAVAREWTRRNPQAQAAWAALAGVLISAGRYDEALDARARATASPFDAYDGVFPAVVDMFAGRFPAADRRLRGLLESANGEGERWQARWILLLSLRHQRRWEEALELARAEPPARDTSVVVREQRRALRLLRALVHLESGRADAAAAALDSLIRVPGVVATPGGLARRQLLHYTLLAEAAADGGDRARLRAAADSAAAWAARSSNPRDRRIAEHARALVQLAAGDTAGAVARLDDAITSTTLGFTRTSLRRARLLLQQRRAAEAVPLLRAGLRGSLESLNLYATHTDFHELLGEAYEMLGQPDSARAHRAWVAAVTLH
jgi:tetratricopeptide (TPR) repeat protein